jgi:hypothetical protein
MSKLTPQQEEILNIAKRFKDNLSAGIIAEEFYGEDNKNYRNLIVNQISRMRRLKMWPYKMVHSIPLNTPKSNLDIAVNGLMVPTGIIILAQIDKLIDSVSLDDRQIVINYLKERFK